MEMIIQIAISAVMLGLLFLIFFWTPYNLEKSRKIYIFIILAICVAIILVPNDFLFNLNIPFVNKSGNEIISTLLSNNQYFSSVSLFDPSIEPVLVAMIQNLVKSCFVLILLAVIFLLSSIILFIYHLIKYRSRVIEAILGTIVLIFLSAVVALSPVVSLINLNQELKDGLAKDGQTITETYPSYAQYTDLLDTMYQYDYRDSFMNYLTYPTDLLSFNSYGNITRSLQKIKPMLNELKQTGISIMFMQDDFDFYDTKSDTFNFDKIESTAYIALSSKIYGSMPVVYANDIAEQLAKELKARANKSNVLDLSFSKDTLKAQCKDLLNLLRRAIESNLIEKVNNFAKEVTLDNIMDLINSLDSNTIDLINSLSDYPIIRKIHSYLGTQTYVGAGIFTIISLYPALNNWLDEFKTTSMFTTAKDFLVMQGVFAYG